MKSFHVSRIEGMVAVIFCLCVVHLGDCVGIFDDHCAYVDMICDYGERGIKLNNARFTDM